MLVFLSCATGVYIFLFFYKEGGNCIFFPQLVISMHIFTPIDLQFTNLQKKRLTFFHLWCSPPHCNKIPLGKILDFSLNLVRKLFAKLMGQEVSCQTDQRVLVPVVSRTVIHFWQVRWSKRLHGHFTWGLTFHMKLCNSPGHWPVDGGAAGQGLLVGGDNKAGHITGELQNCFNLPLLFASTLERPCLHP